MWGFLDGGLGEVMEKGTLGCGLLGDATRCSMSLEDRLVWDLPAGCWAAASQETGTKLSANIGRVRVGQYGSVCLLFPNGCQNIGFSVL